MSLDIENLYLEFFASIYTTTTTESAFPPTYPCLSHEFPSNCYFSVNYVEHSFSKLRGISAIGSVWLSGHFLYNLKSFLAYSLWLLFRQYLDEDTHPSLFKLSSITPILKKVDTSLVNNYRPISIMSFMSKLFESFV